MSEPAGRSISGSARPVRQTIGNPLDGIVVETHRRMHRRLMAGPLPLVALQRGP